VLLLEFGEWPTGVTVTLDGQTVTVTRPSSDVLAVTVPAEHHQITVSPR